MNSTPQTIAHPEISRLARQRPRRSLVRRNLGWTLFALMLAAFVAGRLIGPRIPDDQQRKWCAVNVRFTAVLGVSLNCASPEFMRDATHPSALLEPGSPLQSKPGMPVVAWFLALPFQSLNAVVPRLAGDVRRPDVDSARIDTALKTFGPSYAAYFILNVLILAGSFGLFRRIHRAGGAAVTRLSKSCRRRWRA
jgi:hypothetical protein